MTKGVRWVRAMYLVDMSGSSIASKNNSCRHNEINCLQSLHHRAAVRCEHEPVALIVGEHAVALALRKKHPFTRGEWGGVHPLQNASGSGAIGAGGFRPQIELGKFS